MGRGVAVAGALVVWLVVLGCNITEPPPFDPRAITRSDREQASDVRYGNLPPLPTTMQAYLVRNPNGTTKPAFPSLAGEEVPPEYVIRLPVRELMQRAASNSAEVRVAGYEPAINETRVVENEAHYDPIFFVNLKWDKQFDRTPGTVIPDPNNPSTNITINVENNNIFTAEAGVKQYLPSGGQISLSQQSMQSEYVPVRYVRNDYWDQELKLQLTQPLLRQFGYEVNWARITIARNDQRISLLDFRKALEDNTNELEKDYWQLYEAQREVEIQEALLRQTRELATLLWEQYLIGGKATHVEASQGASAVRQREQILIRARAHVQDLSDDIKRRMSDPDFPVAGPVMILPADEPVTERINFGKDVEDQINTAFLNRFELGQQQLRVQSADVAKQVAFNGLYPKLDLVASATAQGLSNNYDNAFSDQVSKGHGVYSLGLQLEIPLGNREAWAIYRRAQLQRLQAVESYRNLMNQVSEDVRTAIREVSTTWNELVAARDARFFAEDVLVGLNQRRLSGVTRLDPEFIQLNLDQQERLAEAQRQEALAISNYNIALARVEKAKGTILRYNNIVMAEEPKVWNLSSAPARR
jgi:outer membrane protein TolC